MLDDANHPDFIFMLIQMGKNTTLLKELIVIDKAIDTPIYWITSYNPEDQDLVFHDKD
jgi:AmiR/NasT family two-component response regulator